MHRPAVDEATMALQNKSGVPPQRLQKNTHTPNPHTHTRTHRKVKETGDRRSRYVTRQNPNRTRKCLRSRELGHSVGSRQEMVV